MIETNMYRTSCYGCGKILAVGEGVRSTVTTMSYCFEHKWMAEDDELWKPRRPAPPPPHPSPALPWGRLLLIVGGCFALYYVVYYFVRFCIYGSGFTWVPTIAVCGLLWLCMSVRPNALKLHKRLALTTGLSGLLPLGAYALASGLT